MMRTASHHCPYACPLTMCNTTSTQQSNCLTADVVWQGWIYNSAWCWQCNCSRRNIGQFNPFCFCLNYARKYCENQSIPTTFYLIRCDLARNVNAEALVGMQLSQYIYWEMYIYCASYSECNDLISRTPTKVLQQVLKCSTPYER